MPAPKNNKFAAKPSAEMRTATAIYVRPTAAEREEIEQAVNGGKIAKFTLEAVLEKARRINGK